MTDLTKADVVAALRRVVKIPWAVDDADTLIALADAIERAQEGWLDRHYIPKWSKPAKGGDAIWIIPAPRLP